MPSFAAMSLARSTSNPRGLTTVLPRSVPTWKPTAGGLRPTVSSPGLSVGAAVRRAVAAGIAMSAAIASSGRKRFTRGPPVSLELETDESIADRITLQGSRVRVLEVPDQLLAPTHQIAVLERRRTRCRGGRLRRAPGPRWPTWSSNSISSSIHVWSTARRRSSRGSGRSGRA